MPLTKKGPHQSPVACGLAAALIWLAAFGCGQTPSSSSPPEAQLSRLGLSYGLYAGRHAGKPPSDIDELRRYVGQSMTQEQLAALGAASAAELFVSPRDGKPYKMISLPHLPPPAAGQQPPVVLYEQVGQAGKRYVARLGGAVEEVDESTFQQLVPTK